MRTVLNEKYKNQKVLLVLYTSHYNSNLELHSEASFVKLNPFKNLITKNIKSFKKLYFFVNQKELELSNFKIIKKKKFL